MHRFKAKDGNVYTIDLDDGENIEVRDNQRNQIGSVTLLHVNADCNDYKMESYFYLQHLALDDCKRLGIGREIFRLHIKYFGEVITAAQEDGPVMDDGSHLINDGIPFVRKMREIGYIC